MNNLIGILIATLLSVTITAVLTSHKVSAEYESKFEVFQKSQAIRDSIIQQDSIAIASLHVQRDSLLSVQGAINKELDSTIAIIKSHTTVSVTDSDVIEALSWIRDTHGTE